MTKMNNIMQIEIAENFSRHHFENTYPYFSENIQWHLIGDKTLLGKESIIATCNQSAQYLSKVTTNFIKFKIIVGKDVVVIDSLADYTDSEQAFWKTGNSNQVSKRVTLSLG
jgi:hypothetical protein